MQQLSGLDAEFLAMESAEVFGHVGSVCLLDPSTADGPFDLARIAAHLEARLHLVPAMRRRVVEVPFGLDHPYWADDPAFSLDRHVHELALPSPGDDAVLAREVARLHARPLDRARPLWELHLLTGLSGGRVAVYTKVHHAATDGVGGDTVLAAVLDPSPRPRPVPPAADRAPRPLPGGAGLLGRGALSLARRPLRAASTAAELLRHAPGMAATAVRIGVPGLGGEGDVRLHLGLRAPRTPFNDRITADRCCAFADLPLPDVAEVRHRTGTTVNDVVMALTAGALRRWLADHDALPDVPLVAAVPVSVRAPSDGAGDRPGAGHGGPGNQVSAVLAALPTDVPDPLARLDAAARAMRTAKAAHASLPPALLADTFDLAPPALAGLAWRVSARLGLMQRVNPWNLFVSNVPGPRIPLYYAGARLLAYHPLSALAHGQGLNVTVISYAGRLCFGVLAARALVPDVDRLAAALGDELRLLVDAAARVG